MRLSWFKYQATGKFISAAILVTSSFAAQAEPVFPAVAQICGEEYANAQLYADAFEAVGWQVIDGIEVPEAAIQAISVGLMSTQFLPDPTLEDLRLGYSKTKQIIDFGTSENSERSIIMQRVADDKNRVLFFGFSDRGILETSCMLVSDFDDEREWILSSEMQPVIRPFQDRSLVARPVNNLYYLDLGDLVSDNHVLFGTVTHINPEYFDQRLNLNIATDAFMVIVFRKF